MLVQFTIFQRDILTTSLIIFVDEAGQVSLANLIAMGRAGKNIILIGDQMQLSQPTKGGSPRKLWAISIGVSFGRKRYNSN